jgi:CheY-like chemotaxis protein
MGIENVATPQEKTILVVDDEDDVREFLSTVLEDSGFQVVTAVDGADALNKVEQGAPDLISLDLVMPNKSGMRFLHDLRRRQEWRDIPVVVVTAHANDDLGRDDLQEIFADKGQLGPRMYLEKPVEPDQYAGLMCEILGVGPEQELREHEVERMRHQLHLLVDEAEASKLPQLIRLLRSVL